MFECNRENVNIINKLNTYCYYAFIICFPFLIPSILGGDRLPKLLGLSVIFLGLGLILNLIVIIKEKKIEFLLNSKNKKLFYLYIYVITSMFLMSVFLSYHTGNVYGQSTLKIFVEYFVKYTFLFLIILYNFLMLNKERLQKVIQILFIETVVGCVVILLQILLLLFEKFSGVYDLINILNLLPSSSFIINLNRICGFGYEPSYFCLFHLFISFPVLMYLITQKKINSTIPIIFIGIITLGTFLTKSSTVYIAFIIMLIIMLCIYFKKISARNRLCIVCGGIAVLLVILTIKPTRQIVISIIFKIFDINNLSTVYRYSTIFNDIMCFLNFPFFGVGDGNQGFFYNENILNSVFNNPESMEIQCALNGVWGILNGGPFIFSLISGFGVVGIIVFVKIIINNISLAKDQKYLSYYLLSLIPILTCSLVSFSIDFNYIFIFILCLPSCLKEEKYGSYNYIRKEFKSFNRKKFKL